MKRLLKYIIFSLLTVVSVNDVLACWAPWELPVDYYMYRVDEVEFYKQSERDQEFNLSAMGNCREWQRITSADISEQDIYHVVYKMSLKELESLRGKWWVWTDNKFEKWIHKDTEILDFLILAMNNEAIRSQIHSKWYYPTMKIGGASVSLDDVVEKACANTSPRLRDRYLLQAVRALFSMGRYDECIKLWNEEIIHLPETNLMRRLIHPYIAGAECHAGRVDEAIMQFAKFGDMQSLIVCLERKNGAYDRDDDVWFEAFEMVCKYAPNSASIPPMLQQKVRKWEIWNEELCDDDYARMRKLCSKMANDKRVENPAMWYYTAAFLTYLKESPRQVLPLLNLAEKAKSNDYIAESVAVFRMYLDARISTYDSKYEAKLLEQIKWLDEKMVANLGDKSKISLDYFYDITLNLSFYYWNDMMRKILLGEVCPRMVEAGNYTRALQLANMADNRMYGLVDRCRGYKFNVVNGEYEYAGEVEYSLKEYRYDEHNFNIIDYSNCFFELVDSIGVDRVVRYVDRVRKPSSEMDAYLNSRGYVGDDYLNDIVGTQYLRNMQYDKAVEYLKLVSEEYNRSHLNVDMYFAPFAVYGDKKGEECNTRYEFAREMLALEQGFQNEQNPNRKAQLMVKFAIGLRNSFDMCWELTQYYRGLTFWGSVCEKRDWEKEAHLAAAMKRVNALVEEANAIITDDEVGAEINYELRNFKIVAERFPNSEKGRLVKGKCDKLYDYHVERRRGYYF